MKQGMVNNEFAKKLLAQIADIQSQAQNMQTQVEAPDAKHEGKTFSEHLKDGIEGVSAQHSLAEKMATDLSTGKTGNIHETMLAATQAELSFNLMVQVRNKALEAYTEIMRMPV